MLSRLVAERACMSWALKAVTETGTRWRFSLRFSAVTITSCSSAAGASVTPGSPARVPSLTSNPASNTNPTPYIARMLPPHFLCRRPPAQVELIGELGKAWTRHRYLVHYYLCIDHYLVGNKYGAT